MTSQAEPNHERSSVNKNIHWIDSVLIWSGSIMLIALLICGGVASAAGGDMWVKFLVFGGILGAVAALGTGIVIRRKENRMIVIWNILENTTEVSVQDLEWNTGFDRAFIEESIRIINTKGLGFFVWDRRSDTIVDGRLRTTMMTVTNCPSCGGQIDQKVPLDLSFVPRCAYCDRALSVDHLNQLKSKVISTIRPAAPSVAAKRSGGFRVSVFLFLLFIFWPLGIAYAVWKSGVFANASVEWQA